MRTALAALSLSLVVSGAYAQAVPIPRDGRKACPYSFNASGSGCLSNR